MKISKIMLTLGISACMAIILFRPDVYVASALEGVKLWALVVLPSLLPFFFFTSLLAKIGATERMARTLKKPCEQIFGTSGYAAYAFLMSILSGYPVGAKIIGDLGENGLIDETDATKMSAFCSTSGPLFIVGSVSVGMFGSVAAGKLLFLAHTLSALITGVIFRFYRQTKKTTTSADKNAPQAVRPRISPAKKKAENNNVLYDCVYSSVVSLATVGGFICVFYVLADIFQNLDILYPLWKTLCFITKNETLSKAFSYGLIECTRGCKMLALCGLSTYSLAFASSLIAFGGVSVLVQSVCFLKKANVKISVFLLAKTVQTVISFLLTLAFAFAAL
ncbi:MAG: hypothetical protein SOT09_05160 [Candidatus Borkfalkiaceae bacterium]|nr:hypothetical protein [Christensenellaceae bacterium]